MELGERAFPVFRLQVGVESGGELVEDGFDCWPDGRGPVGEGVVLFGESVEFVVFDDVRPVGQDPADHVRSAQILPR